MVNFTTATVVQLTKHHSPGGDVIRAFVETGSDNAVILAQLAESNVSGPIRNVFCGPRTHGENQGVLVTVRFEGEVPANAYVSVVLIQVGALRYQEPIRYDGD